MRKFTYLTVSTITEELTEELKPFNKKLKKEGKRELRILPIYINRFERRIPGFPRPQKFPGDWRRYSREEVDRAKRLIKDWYKLTG